MRSLKDDPAICHRHHGGKKLQSFYATGTTTHKRIAALVGGGSRNGPEQTVEWAGVVMVPHCLEYRKARSRCESYDWQAAKPREVDPAGLLEPHLLRAGGVITLPGLIGSGFRSLRK